MIVLILEIHPTKDENEIHSVVSFALPLLFADSRTEYASTFVTTSRVLQPLGLIIANKSSRCFRLGVYPLAYSKNVLAKLYAILRSSEINSFFNPKISENS